MDIRNSLVRAGSLLACVLTLGLAGVVAHARGEEAPESFPAGTQEEHKAPAESTDAIIEYSHDPNDVVVQMKRVSTLIGLRSPRGDVVYLEQPILLRIYGDGRVEVRERYGLRLTDKEMRDLLSSLSDKGVFHFDAKAIKRRKAEVKIARRRQARDTGVPEKFQVVADGSTTVIEVRLNSYTPSGGEEVIQKNFHQEIRWYEVQVDAEWYPEIQQLRDLAAAEKELLALTTRKDLQRLEEK